MNEGTKAQRPARKLPGTIAHYEIIKELGRGGMGSVYLAVDPWAGNRKVAIKSVLLGDDIPAERRDALRRRLRREAEALGRIRHPNVPTLYHALEEGPTLYLVMEFVEGNSLRDLLLRDEGVSRKEAVRISVSVLRALEAAHAEGLVHRDVKPSNIMLTADGTVKLIDFGLAKDIGSDTRLTHTDGCPGTPGYKAPEQIAGNGASAASDLFCVGVVLYEMLTRSHPFRGGTESELNFSVLYEAPTHIRELEPTIPESLANAVMRALSKNPADRFESAAQMAAELEEASLYLSNPTGSGRVVGPFSGRKPEQLAHRRALTLWLLLGLAAGVVATLVLFFGRGLQEWVKEVFRQRPQAAADAMPGEEPPVSEEIIVADPYARGQDDGQGAEAKTPTGPVAAGIGAGHGSPRKRGTAATPAPGSGVPGVKPGEEPPVSEEIIVADPYARGQDDGHKVGAKMAAAPAEGRDGAPGGARGRGADTQASERKPPAAVARADKAGSELAEPDDDGQTVRLPAEVRPKRLDGEALATIRAKTASQLGSVPWQVTEKDGEILICLRALNAWHKAYIRARAPRTIEEFPGYVLNYRIDVDRAGLLCDIERRLKSAVTGKLTVTAKSHSGSEWVYVECEERLSPATIEKALAVARQYYPHIRSTVQPIEEKR